MFEFQNIAIANCFKTGRYYGCDGGITNFKSSQRRGIQLSKYNDKVNCCSRKRLGFREGVKVGNNYILFGKL